ncbi:MAG: glycosyltransferase, partial [Bacteroidota bacterium]
MAKVAIIGTAYPFRGGLAAYNERLAREFQAQGDDVVIYTFSLQYPNFLFPGKTQYADWEAPADLDIRVRVNAVNPLNWWSVGREIRKQHFDLVIIKFWLPFMGPCFGTIARQIRKAKNTRLLCILDNVIPHEKRFGDKPFTRYFIRSMEAFVAMSQSVLDDLGKFNSTRPRALQPHPIFDNFGALVPKTEAQQRLELSPAFRYILFFGFVREYKGLDWLIEAFASKRLRQFNLKLIVAGEFYVDPDRYLQLIEQHGLKDHVVLRNDFIPDNAVADYFNACDLVVQPYKNATQSGVTQIGYHFNKPMIVTDVGGLAEIIPDGKVGYVTDTTVLAISMAG